MKTYLTDLNGLTYVDPSLEEVLIQVETLIDSDLFDFPEIILSDSQGHSLLISRGYTIVFEKDETELGILREGDLGRVKLLVKAMISGELGVIRKQNWQPMDL